MAIAKMKKLHLIGMAYDKDRILNALHKTGAAEIKWQTDVADTTPIDVDTEELSVRIAAVEAALTALVTETENYEKERDLPSSIEKDGFDVRYSEFVAVKDRRDDAEAVATKIAKLTDRRNSLKGELSKAKRELEQAKLYEAVPQAFSLYKDSAHTRTRIGAVSATVKAQVFDALGKVAFCDLEEFSAGESVVFAVFYHKRRIVFNRQSTSIIITYDFIKVKHSCAIMRRNYSVYPPQAAKHRVLRAVFRLQ